MQLVADDAVVRDVHVGQHPVVVADAGDAAAVAGAAVDGDELADRVAVADHQFGALAGVLLVLRIAADRGDARWMRLSRPMRVGPVITQCGPMLVPSPISTSAPMTQNAPTLHVARRGARPGRSCAVGWIVRRHGSGLASAQRISAQATCSPSTLREHSYRRHVADHALELDVAASSWSPGTTICEKRALSILTR